MNSINSFIWLFIVLVGLTSGAHAGVLIGNGDGLVEENVFYAYESVSKAITSCVDFPRICGVNADDIAVLKRIRALADRYPATPKNILFVSSQDQPHFFDLGAGQADRIAQTGLVPASPIYFNADQFYDQDGRPALDIPVLIAILIHELGHHLGLTDHGYLDQLGSRVRGLLSSTDSFAIAFPSTRIEVLGYNYPNSTVDADLYVTDGSTSNSLNELISGHARCSDHEATPLGWKIWNGHWSTPDIAPGAGNRHLIFSVFVTVQCAENGVLQSATSTLNIDMTFVRKPNGQFSFKSAQ